MKRRGGLYILILLTVLLLFPVAARAEGKLNVAVISSISGLMGSDQEASSMMKKISSNKLPKYRFKNKSSLYYDAKKNPTTHNRVDVALAEAFSASTKEDVNYLYCAGHGGDE